MEHHLANYHVVLFSRFKTGGSYGPLRSPLQAVLDDIKTMASEKHTRLSVVHINDLGPKKWNALQSYIEHNYDEKSNDIGNYRHVFRSIEQVHMEAEGCY